MSEDQHMGNLYQRFPVTIEKGVGAHVWDTEGKEYIDCMGGYGVALVGHQNQRVNNAIKEQVDKIITVHSSLYNKTREEFLKKLIEIAPEGLTQVHLNNSGAEAVEAAMKFARKFTGKKGMVAMKGSYHGKSFGALSLTFNPKYRKAFAPLVEKVSFASFGDMDSLRSVIDEDTALIILEPIQGESGIIVAPDGFLQEVRKLCDEKGILLIFDEIQAGLGRTGRLWAGEHWNTAPDILCLAKGIAGGVPMGATLVRPDILAAISKGEHSSTFGGNPLAMAVGNSVMDIISNKKFLKNVKSISEYFLSNLKKIQNEYPKIIKEIRGRGLLIGIQLKIDQTKFIKMLMDNNLLTIRAAENVVRILPPLNVKKSEINQSLKIIKKVCSELN